MTSRSSAILRSLVAAPCIVAAGAVAAGAQSVPRDTTVLPTARVIGSILPDAGPAVGSGVPARTAVIDGAAVERWRPRTLADALGGQVGITAYDDLGSPYKLTLQSRGFAVGPVVGLGQGLSVFLDGVPVNEPDAAQVNFDLLPLDRVTRIEVLSGTAALLGPNTLGGAINLVTQRDDAAGPGPDGEIELSGGSYGLASGDARVAGVRHDWRYDVGGGVDRERGWRQATATRRSSFLMNLGRTGGERGLTIQAYAAESRAETAGSLPASVFVARPDSNLSAHDFEDLSQLHLAVAGYTPLGAGRASMHLYLRSHDAERLNVNQQDDPDVRSFAANRTAGASVDWRVHGPALGGDASLRLGASGTVNRVGIRLVVDRSKLGGGDSLTTSVSSPIARGGAFAAADARYGRVTLSAGARYDAVRIPFRDRLRDGMDTTSLYRRLDPSGGIAIALGTGRSVYALLGQSFRAPAIIELACADPDAPCPLPFSLGDDPPLAPVVATTAEIGGRWTPRRLPLSLSASAYRTVVRDDIALLPYDGDDAPAGSTVDGYFANLARTRRAGVELAAESQLMPRSRPLTVRASYTYTRATFESPVRIASAREGAANDVEPGDRMPLVPAHTVHASADLALPRAMQVGAAVRYTGARWLRGDEANETPPLPGSTVADLRGGVDLRAWTLDVVVANVFDRRYATFGSYSRNEGADDRVERFLTPGEPRTLRIALHRRFGRGAADPDR